MKARAPFFFVQQFMRLDPDKKKQAEEAYRKTTERAAQLAKALGKKSERTSQAELMAAKRRAERDIVLPNVVDPDRRIACEADPYLFIDTYLAELFDDYQPWTDNRRRIVDEIQNAIQRGGDKAIAAPRGEGKSTLAEALVGVESIVTGKLRFPVIVAATGPTADEILNSIKRYFEGDGPFTEDYPEVCVPVKALERAPQRANQQTINGEFTLMQWAKNMAVFPTVTLTWCPLCYRPDPHKMAGGGLHCQHCGHKFQPYKSKASGAILKTRGLDSAIRGLKIGSKRPDFVLIDDPDTEESAKSYPQTADRETRIERALGGLGSSRKPVSRLMLTTISTVISVSARYTDRMQKPSWGGDRLRLVIRWPDKKELWDKYIEKRQEGMQSDPPDKEGRLAHQFYLDNKEEMDAGCVVSNPLRFSEALCEDGSQRQVSTIQAVHDDAADKGWDYVFCELQNDPPEEETTDGSHLTVGIVSGSAIAYKSRLTGVPQNVVPEDVEYMTAFVDVQHDRLYYEVCAWLDRGRRHVIDYACFGRDLADKNMRVDDATTHRLLSLKAYWDDMPYRKATEAVVPISLVLVDSGDQATTIYNTCLLTGWMPSHGAKPYRLPQKSTTGGTVRKSPNGDPWHISMQVHSGRKVRMISFDVDEFKQRTKSAWFIDPVENPPNCIHLFGEDPPIHRTYAMQVCAEKFERWFDEGKGWKEKWVPHGADNHFWDCSVGNTLARSVWEAFGKQRAAAPNPAPPSTPQANPPAPMFPSPGGRPFLVTER